MKVAPIPGKKRDEIKMDNLKQRSSDVFLEMSLFLGPQATSISVKNADIRNEAVPSQVNETTSSYAKLERFFEEIMH